MWVKVLAGLLSLMLLGGCNTFYGFGKDVERVGEKIQKKAS